MRTSTKLSLAMLLGAALLTFLAHEANDERRALAHGVTADATVVGFHNCSPCGKFDSNYYIIDVPVAGHVIHTGLANWSWRGTRLPGSIVRVRYATEDPAELVQDAGLPLGSGGRNEALGAVALTLAALETWRSSRSRAWKRVGRALDRF